VPQVKGKVPNGGEGKGNVPKSPPYNREQILRNIEESKQAREASNFDEYLKKEKELHEQLKKGTGDPAKIGSRTVAESLDKVNSIRQEFNIGSKRNIAFAEYEINGSKGEVMGVSGKADRVGTAGVPSERKFETITTPDGNPRTLDAEVKILEELASKLPSDASGKIYLFSELPFCDSCSGVIKQFKELFPNTEIILSHGPSKTR